MTYLSQNLRIHLSLVGNLRKVSVTTLICLFYVSSFQFLHAQSSTQPPPAYASLYSNMSENLDAFEKIVREIPEPQQRRPLIFGSDLSFANNNNGPYLFSPRVQEIAKLQAERFQEMGIGGVHLTIQWPEMSKTYDPDYQKYLDFYVSLAEELRSRHITIFLHNSCVFGKPFSMYDHSVPHITFNEYKREKREMVQNLINAIHPEYYIIASEPKTDANNTGISELDNPASSRELADYVINGDGQNVGPLEKGTTSVGMGADTWETMDFAQGYATIPNLDFISIHVYPLSRKHQQALLALVDIAKSHNKRMLMDEAWLYKVDTAGVSQPEAFKRDMFSFFEPLDQRFFSLMGDFCRKEGIEFLSGFWARNFFTYLDYNDGDENVSYEVLGKKMNEAVKQAIIEKKLSPLGEFYSQMIKQGP